jgi:hypothetical protein
MKPRSFAIIISLSVLLMVTIYSSVFENVIAQTAKINSSISQGNKTNILDKTPSFSARGAINTVIYLVINNTLTDPQDKAVSLSNLTGGLDSAAKSLIDGNWTLNVNNGKVQEFNANLSSINADASNYHTHILGNFTSDVNPQVAIDPNSIIKIKGKIDVGLNGETVWKQVNSDISLFKNKTITITLDDKDTEDHFAQQHIYGKIKSFVG